MSRGWGVLVVVGIGAVIAAVAVAVRPALAAGIDPSRLLLVVFGALALLQGVLAVRGRLRRERASATFPDVEEREAVAIPGADFDDLLARGAVPGRRTGARARDGVRDRLEAAAVGTLALMEGCSREAARERLFHGDWSEDPQASAFFTDEFPELSLRDRLRLSLRSESGFQRRARHVVGALATRLDLPIPTRPVPRGVDEVDDPHRPLPLDRETERWAGIGAVAMLAMGVGVLTSNPPLVLAAVVGVGFAAYTSGGSAPDPSLSLTRRVSDAEPAPGDEVEVAVTVENTGESTLPDLRLVDGVPPTLSVTDGSPRHGTALRPGERATFAYSVRTTRGDHAFEPATVLARDWSGSVERELELAAETATPITCVPPLQLGEAFPLRAQTSGQVGRVTTDTGGTGLEFHSVREYRPGDPTSRIDWKRAARTGELATLQFREEQSATVVLLVDAREEAYVAPAPDATPAVDHSVEAAGEVFTALQAAGDRVGIAAFAPRTCWLPPAAGAGHRARARDLLATHPALSATRPERPFYSSVQLRRLRRRLPSDAQLVFFTPLVDDYVVSVARRLDAYGHLVTVLSPDPTTTGSAGQTLATIERQLRLSELRGANVPTIDWAPDAPLATTIERARRRWSK